jgi:hypothetical protein
MGRMPWETPTHRHADVQVCGIAVNSYHDNSSMISNDKNVSLTPSLILTS